MFHSVGQMLQFFVQMDHARQQELYVDLSMKLAQQINQLDVQTLTARVQ